MNCVFEFRDNEPDGRIRYRCVTCGQVIVSKYSPEKVTGECGIHVDHVPYFGTGTVLTFFLKILRVKERKKCVCGALRETMNSMGRSWCWKNRRTIIGLMYREAKRRNLKIPVGIKTGTTLLALSIAVSVVLTVWPTIRRRLIRPSSRPV